MKFNYQLQSVLGSVYRGGSLLFTSDGRTLISPIGNRISFIDLISHSVHTIDAVTHRNIEVMTVSPDGKLLLCIDVEGGGCFVNLKRRIILAQIHFSKPVSAAQFSPDSRLLAITHSRLIQVWRCPSLITSFRPLTLLRTITGHYDEVRCLQWSEDGAYLLSGSEDMSVRVHRIDGSADSSGTEEGKDKKVKMAGEGGESGQGRVKSEDAMEDDENNNNNQQAAAAASSSSSSSAAVPHLPPITLIGHRSCIVGAYFGQSSAHYSQTPMVYTISKDGSLFVWDWWNEKDTQELREKYQREREEWKEKQQAAEEENGETSTVLTTGREKSGKTHHLKPKRGVCTDLFGTRGKFKLLKKHYFQQPNSKVLCTAIHRAAQVDLLVVGFSTGIFGLYELPDFNPIHTLSISQKRISSVSINPSGTWLAFGCEKLGSLLVWEWESESYILKQQGHYYDINCIAFSSDSQILATGGEDGRVKLWNTKTGYCFITFTNHTAPVTACVWVSEGSGNVLVTSSMDGTVRAYDLVRYRNFRTFTTPHESTQFTSLACDPSGEIICASSQDPFEIYIWSLQTGKLLDVLTGHAGPVSCLSFHGNTLASSSWDKTVKLWDVFNGKGLIETFSHTSDILCCSFRPTDGKEICTSTLDGNLCFWDTSSGNMKYLIEGAKDIRGGRRVSDSRTAATSTHNTCFTTISYTSDGKSILAGGNSKYICLYDIGSKLLLKKFVISSNLSYDGLLDKLNTKAMSEAGVSMDLIDDEVLDEYDDDPESRIDRTLPGAKRGDFSSRRTRLAVRSKCVRFTPTGESWAASTTDGLLIYSLDSQTIFDPFELSVDITPKNVYLSLRNQDYSTAVKMALSLNEEAILQEVVESIPVEKIPLIVRSIPSHRFERFLTFLTTTLMNTAHLEYILLWSRHFLTIHSKVLLEKNQTYLTQLRSVLKTVKERKEEVEKICNENTFTLEYLATLGRAATTSTSSSSPPETSSSLNGTSSSSSFPRHTNAFLEEEQDEDEDVEMKDDGAEEEEEVEEEEEAPKIVVKKEKPSPRLAPTAIPPTNAKSHQAKQPHVPHTQQQLSQKKKHKLSNRH